MLELAGVHFLNYRDSGMPGSEDNYHPQALAAQPECVLYDEPTTMVDPIMSNHLGDLMVRLKRQFGKNLCFWGAVDTQQVLPFGTCEQVRGEVFKKLDLLWEGGGYLPEPEKTLGVPQDNLDAMTQAIREWSSANVGKPGEVRG